ncbi:MAG: N-acetylneuraminate synthase family protein [Anaerolineales bacterium]|jgi:N-acetylneuraminate synthase
MTEIQIGDRLIGNGHPTYIIAEIGVNHNGIPQLAFELIDIAVEAGADAVKFQKRNLRTLYPKKYLDNVNAGEKSLRYLLPILQKVELPDSTYQEIVKYCKKKGITFLCSPFDRESADFLETLDVPAYKVASADLTNLPLIDHLVKKKKPLILSTGMSRPDEVDFTVKFLKERNVQFALLHCNSTYPAAFEDINLRYMDQLRKYNVPVGYSGHERGIAVSMVAAALGANILERHITLDRAMDGPDHAASLEPQGFKKMVRDIHLVTLALGTGEEKFFSRGEILNRETLAKSLVAARQIEPGEIITDEMITVKGPGLGLSPQRYPELLGRRSERVVGEDEPFVESDLGIHPEREMEHTLPMQWGFTVRFRDYKELMVHKPQFLEFHFTDADLKEKYAGADYDMPLVVHAPEFWERTLVDLCATDVKQRIASVALIQKSVNQTRDMAKHFKGKPKVIVHAGGMTLDQSIHDNRPLYENLSRSVEQIDSEEVEILLENLPPHPWYFGGQWITNAFMDANEIRDFIIPRKLNICFDTSHSKLYCNWAHVDFYEQVRSLLPYTHHLHISDGSGLDGEGLQIGEGNIDWVRFFHVTKDYHGTMIPEIWRGHQHAGQGFLQAIQRLSVAYSKAHEEDESKASQT